MSSQRSWLSTDGGRRRLSFVSLFLSLQCLVTPTWSLMVGQQPFGPAPAPMTAPGPSPYPGPAGAAYVASYWTAAQWAARPLSPVSYAKHGTDWSEGQCSVRSRQSPISLDTRLEELPTAVFKYNYFPITNPNLQLQAINGTLSMDLAGMGLGGIEYKKTTGLVEQYWLSRLDIRGPSDHLFEGKQMPLELQLVHQEVTAMDGTPGKYLIIAITVWAEHPPSFVEGPPPIAYAVPNPAEADFSEILKHFTASVRPAWVQGQSVPLMTTSPANPLNLEILLEDAQAVPNEQGRFFAYAGGLTSPPCDEEVTWLVRRSKHPASDGQVKALGEALFALTVGAGSFRRVMPLNKRVTTVYRPEKVDLIVPLADPLAGGPPRKWIPVGPNPRTDGEFRALRAAQVAKDMAQEAAAYTGDVAARHMRAENAYSYELSNEGMNGSTWVAPPPTTTPSLASVVADKFKLAIRGQARTMRDKIVTQAHVNTLMTSVGDGGIGNAPSPAVAAAARAAAYKDPNMANQWPPPQDQWR